MTAARPTHGAWRRVAAIALSLCVSTAFTTAQGRRTDLDGVWILASSAKFENLELTPAGQTARAKYDYLTNDPGMQCIPASVTRVMHTPSPPIEIRQHADHVEITYEFMDVHRRVPLKPGLAVSSAPYAVAAHRHLGRSVARYDGETLVVETGDIGAGVHDTLGMPGLPQSNQMRTVERFTANGNRMEIAVTHRDPVFYTKPYTATFSYLRLPGGKILPWDCTPEEADYKRFLPSAAPPK
jgi:hypothetical protein